MNAMPATPMNTARPRVAPDAETQSAIGMTAMPTAATAARHAYVRGARAAERASRAATGQSGILLWHSLPPRFFASVVARGVNRVGIPNPICIRLILPQHPRPSHRRRNAVIIDSVCSNAVNREILSIGIEPIMQGLAGENIVRNCREIFRDKLAELLRQRAGVITKSFQRARDCDLIGGGLREGETANRQRNLIRISRSRRWGGTVARKIAARSNVNAMGFCVRHFRKLGHSPTQCVCLPFAAKPDRCMPIEPRSLSRTLARSDDGV